MLARWDAYTPALRRAVLEGIFSREAWLAVLLDHVAAGKVARNDLDAARRQTLLTHRNDAIRTRAAKLFEAALDGDRAMVVESHRDVLKLAGDATRGKAMFGKHCIACHRLEGVGQDVGAELDALANRSPDALLIAILDPNRAVEDKFLGYAVRAMDGRQLSGILASETSNSLTLVGQDAKREELLRTEIDEVKATGKSFMPEGLEKDLSKQDLADLIAYIGRLGPQAKHFAGNEPGLVEAAADGSLVLPASKASIFGPSLVFEQHYGNLGHWSNVADQATWRVRVPKAGAYRVVLDYACDDGNAGNTFVVEATGAAVTYKVGGTGTWDDYREATIGTLPLPAGEVTVVARPSGEPKSAILDLRTVKLVKVADN
jgi:putative heme-binding domain-containing protein